MKRLTTILIVSATLALGGSVPLHAADKSPASDVRPQALDSKENPMSTDYKETSPSEILHDVATLYGYELVSPPSLHFKGKMNLILKKVSPKEVLDIVVPLCGCTWSSTPTRIIVSEKQPNQASAPTAPSGRGSS